MASGPIKQTLSAQAAGTKLRGRYMTNASKSLDLVRLNIQTLINKEIDAVLKKYLDKFFIPAIKNIRCNLGENSVSEENIKIICRKILEDAKVQYYSSPSSRGSSPFSDSESGNLGKYRLEYSVPKNLFLNYHSKRKEPAAIEIGQPVIKQKKKSSRLSNNIFSGIPAPLKVMKVENVKREGPKWDPNRIVKSTLFIMGARANKVLGFGQTRGRLYTKHPELLKYSGDTEDKEWLARHNLIPPTGGIAYLLILEDVKELAQSEEYRHNPNVLLYELKGFKAPDFMLKKIRAFIAQSSSNEKITFMNSNEINDSTKQQNNFNDSETSAITPSGTILQCHPTEPCEYSEFTDYSHNLFSSVQCNRFFASGASNYDEIIFTQNNKFDQLPQLCESGCGDKAKYFSLPSFLVTSSKIHNKENSTS